MRLPVVMIIVSYLLLILTDWMILSDLRSLSVYSKYKPTEMKKRRVWWKVYGVFALLILAVLTVAICMPRTDESKDITAVMWLLYIVLSVLFSQIAYCIFSLLGFIPVLFKRRRWNTGLWVGLPLGVLIFSMMWWGALIGRNKIEINYVEISSPKIPDGFNGYRIAQISDLHVGTWGHDPRFLERLVDSVNNLHPDIILFTGDIVNRKADELRPFVNTLAELKAPDGVFSVLGNHDYGDYVAWKNEAHRVSNLNSLKDMEKEMGWQMLDNRHVFLRSEAGDSIALIGVGNWGEPPFSQYGDLKKAYSGRSLKDENFKILLSHNPEHWNREVSKTTNIDLTLAGHTHAMQIMFEVGNWRMSPSQWKYDQWGGLYERHNDAGEATKVYVNIGAGEVGMPMRIGATPEVTLFTLKRK